MSDNAKKDIKEFSIFKMEIPADKSYETPKPHRHDFQEIIFLEKGKATHNIDTESHKLNGPVIILVARGKMHTFIPANGSKLYAVRFAEEFLPEQHEGLFCPFMQLSKITIESDQALKTFSELLSMMYHHYVSGEINPNFTRHLLAALLSIINNEREKIVTGEKRARTSSYEIFNKFLFNLEANFISEKSVTFYSEKLNVSQKKLSEISKEIFGDSPSRIIEKRAMLEAKRLLIYSGQTIQEIAFELGFNDHSYFTKAFHKNEGVTPTEFREKHKPA